MNKKTIRLLIAALALILLLTAGLPLLSRLVYGRSQAATLFAWQLQKEAYTTPEAFEDYLETKRLENSEPYVLPLELPFTVSCRPVALGGLPGYELNREAEGTTVFYFPGGSYTDAPREVHWQFLDDLAARSGARIVVPVYPRLPENDAGTAYAAVTDFYTACLADREPGRIVFMGDSAGGGMALSLAMQLRDAGLPGPEALILLSPWLDVALEDPEIPAYEKKDPALDSEQLRHLGALWAGGLDPDDPVVSPLYGDLDGLGEITLLAGTGELLYPDIAALDRRLTEAGLPHELAVWSGMFHVWPLYEAYDIPEADEAVSYILRRLG